MCDQYIIETKGHRTLEDGDVTPGELVKKGFPRENEI